MQSMAGHKPEQYKEGDNHVINEQRELRRARQVL